MKRVHFPAYSPMASQRITAPRVSIRARMKPIEPLTPPGKWPYQEIGTAILSFPSDLRPRAV